MSIQPRHDLLFVLSDTLRKIDADPVPTSSLMDLRQILIHRIAALEPIAALEAGQMLARRGDERAR